MTTVKPNIRKMIDAAVAKAQGETPAPDEDRPAREPATLAALTLFSLQTQSHVYGGTVPPEVVAKRRARNRNARRARRGNTAAIRRQARSNRVANRHPRFGYSHNHDPLGTKVVDAEVVED
ncbi:hypothetical protein PBI_HILLTOPFARM_57 [Mycobacterium phage Hilltopfarm]|nr:hypothetical protein PBI_HILLTOPFARM_57 [Mycobacterium phage Hilltopfarm]